MLQPSPREHVTVINVAGSSGSVFTFDDVSAVLESSGGIASSQLYGTEDDNESNHNALSDPNTLQLRVGNSLGAGGGSSFSATSSYGNSIGVGRPPIPPIPRSQLSSTSSMTSNVNPTNANNGNGGNQYYNGNGHNSTYEPLFLAFSETNAPPPTPTSPNAIPQAPNTGLLRRRSEHRRSGRRDQARRAASVGPSLAPRQPVRQRLIENWLIYNKDIEHHLGSEIYRRKLEQQFILWKWHRFSFHSCQSVHTNTNLCCYFLFYSFL